MATSNERTSAPARVAGQARDGAYPPAGALTVPLIFGIRVEVERFVQLRSAG
jgi:hypothetical protein